MSGWRQARAIAALPGTVTVVVPALLLAFVRGPEIGWGLGGAGAVVVAALGVALVVAGFSLWLWTVVLFHRLGRGTLAAWDPTSRLVVAGPYRHVRNPMISGVAMVLVGEAVFFGSPWIGLWAVLFVAVNHAYFLLAEEPGLGRRFGVEYGSYRSGVPRWLPRATPWRGQP